MLSNARSLVLHLTALLIISSSALAVPLDYLSFENQAKEINPAAMQLTSTQPALELFHNGLTFYICGVDTVDFGAGSGSDCWGWEAPDGTEYAIMGRNTGIAFVDAASAQHLFTVPGQGGSCVWRDMATWGHYCYSVSECGGTNAGLMVLDLQYLPDSVHFVTSVPVNGDFDITSHNLSIDSLKGFIYLEGNSTAGSTVYIHSLADPENPVFVSSFGIGGGIHDIYARNDTAYIAEGSNGSFAIYDMSNKMSPTLLARVAIPSPGYVHNAWPTRDGRHLVTTEETPGRTIKIWNIENLGSIAMTGQFLAPAGLAHNAQLIGDTVFMSHYESGIIITDISNPSAPVQLANFDTYPTETSNYNGAWGVFEATNSGRIYASNLDGRLFIIQSYTVELADTLWADSAYGDPGTYARLDVKIANSHSVREMTIPIQWSGPYGLSLDSISTVGLETDYFQTKTLIDYDSAQMRATISLISSSNGTAPDLEVGRRAIVSLFFNIPDTAYGGPNLVKFNNYDSFQRSFSDGECILNEPEASNLGMIFVDNPCCFANRGNVNSDDLDKVNISDVTFLVDYLFGVPTGSAPLCNKEANANGDYGEKVNISDVTFLTAYLFGVPTGPGPPPCP